MPAAVALEHLVHDPRGAGRGGPGAGAQALAGERVDDGLDQRLLDVRRVRDLERLGLVAADQLHRLVLEGGEGDAAAAADDLDAIVAIAGGEAPGAGTVHARLEAEVPGDDVLGLVEPALVVGPAGSEDHP